MLKLLFALAVAASNPDVVVRVDLSQREETSVPREFFGQFGEHLGDNVYHGQWAQILRNPVFEGDEYFADRRPYKWHEVPDVAAGESLGLACFWLPVGEASYALIEDAFAGALSQEVAIEDQGGLRSPCFVPLHRCPRTEFTFYATSDVPTQCRATLETADGAALASGSVTIDNADWTQYAMRLECEGKRPPGELHYLTLRFKGPVTVRLDNAELFPADAIDGLDPDVVELLRAANTPLIRFPGGNFVSGYNWREGIGPREKRPVRKNPAWGGLETNHFGTDEWMRFCEVVGAKPFICVNAGNGTAEEAADWVRYCNDPPDTPLGRLRAEHGHPEPYNVRWWEVGNELWGPWQIGHCKADEYGKRYEAFAKAMLEAGPDIRLIANGGDGTWNARAMEASEMLVRRFSCHRLIGLGMPADLPAEDLQMGLAAYGIPFDRQLAVMRDGMREHGVAKPKIAVTELMSCAPRRGYRTTDAFFEVPFYAGMVNACIRNRDLVEVVTRTAIINHGGGLGKVRGVTYPQPVHFLSRIYGSMRGRWPVTCRVEAPMYSIDLPQFPDIVDVPVVECMPLVDEQGKYLTLLVTNRDAKSPHTIRFELNGGESRGEAKATILAGAPDTVNTWREPKKFTPSEEIIRTGEMFEYQIPAGAFCAMEMELR
ncbi:MAG: hypothetical protein R6V12_03280 [Candidatus Hydrogenedentota bacterium]